MEAILAECQFELDAGCQENLIAHMPLMTWLEAKHVIETLVEKEGKITMTKEELQVIMEIAGIKTKYTRTQNLLAIKKKL